MHQLGNIDFLEKNYAGAIGWYQKALERKRGLGDRLSIAKTVAQLGSAELAEGNEAEAKRLYIEAYETFKEVGGKAELAGVLTQLAQLAMSEGNPREAFEQSLEAYAIFAQLRNPNLQLVASVMSDIRQQVGDEQFREWLKQSGAETDTYR